MPTSAAFTEVIRPGAIARMLEISPRTVAHHLDNIYRKMEVSGRAAAVYRAVTEGMVTSRNNGRR